jgi:hypothetical protein
VDVTTHGVLVLQKDETGSRQGMQKCPERSMKGGDFVFRRQRIRWGTEKGSEGVLLENASVALEERGVSITVQVRILHDCRLR